VTHENLDRIPVQGVHHITLVGSNRQSAIDFWHGLLGMRQPPERAREADVLVRADALRRKAGDHHITEQHLADAIEQLMAEGHDARK
jgi:catechol 2,3-dioxygenase-like lactoylglutathione lyase family enzyme